MTDVSDDLAQQKLDSQLQALKDLIVRFEEFPKHVSGLAQDAERDPSRQETSEALQQLWEGGLRDNVKKMIGYTQQIIGLQEEFQDLFQVAQSFSGDSVSMSHEQIAQSIPASDTPINDVFSENPLHTPSLEKEDIASQPSTPSARKKTKRFV